MHNLIARPLDAVQRLFQQSGSTDAGDWGVRAAFQAVLADPAALAQVPYLNADTIDRIPQGGLVRYRGMVQDMLDPEYYLGAFRRADGSWVTTKYADGAVTENIAEADMKVWDRKPLYCTAVPGEAPWVAALNPGEQDSTALRPPTPPPEDTAHAAKRGRDDANASDAEDMSLCFGGGDGGTEAGEEAASVKQPRVALQGFPTSVAEVERRAAVEDAVTGQGDMNVDDTTRGQAAALPPPQAGDCMLFVYDEPDAVKLNDVVEFVGVLSRAPELAAPPLPGSNSGLYEDEMASRPPTSQVPRVHAILAAVQRSALPASSASAAASVDSSAVPLRAAAISLLATALGGDELAAEYLLLQLLSRVHTRGEQPLGTLCLNITGCPEVLPASTARPSAASASGAAPSAASSAAGAGASPAAREDAAAGPASPLSALGAAVSAAVSALAARVTPVPLSVPLLNNVRMRPKRDYASNRLVPGFLQLPPLSQLLVDESPMAPGTLANTGCANLQALKTLMDSKTVDYDFEYYQLQQPADVAVTLLSPGASIFKGAVDISIPLAPCKTLVEAAAVAEASEAADLAPVRAYIAAAQAAEFHIDDQAAALVEGKLTEHLAEDRSTDVKTFHNWLTLARLLALSHGETGLSASRWSEMRTLEARRESRLRAPSSASRHPVMLS